MRYILGNTFAITASVTILILGMLYIYKITDEKEVRARAYLSCVSYFAELYICNVIVNNLMSNALNLLNNLQVKQKHYFIHIYIYLYIYNIFYIEYLYISYI